MNEVIGIRGGGDLATGVAWRLHQCGFKVYIMEIPKPMMVRRTVSFAQCLLDGAATVEGVTAVRIEQASLGEMQKVWAQGMIPVIVDPDASSISVIKPLSVIDCTLAKQNLGMHRGMARITIGIGPGFTAGQDVGYVVETMRGHFLGRVITEGTAIPDTGIPESVNGFANERVIRSLAAGTFLSERNIGQHIEAGEIMGSCGGVEIPAKITGVIRGLIANGTEVPEHMKVADIDPRDDARYINFISDKARAIGGGVLEALMRGLLEVENGRRDPGIIE